MGYTDIKQQIVDTLMNREKGTQIQPQNHQEFALALLEYIRQVELITASTLVGTAERGTVPVQSDKANLAYVAACSVGETVVFENFHGQDGQPLQYTADVNSAAIIILTWNKEYWTMTAVPASVLVTEDNVNYTTSIRKTYASKATMEADTNPVDEKNIPITNGQLVSVVNNSDATYNGIYAREGAGWIFQSGFNFGLVQTTGQDGNQAMSQKATTDALATKTEKVRIDIVGTTGSYQFKKGDKVLNFQELNDMLQNSPDFLVFVHGNREHRCTFIDLRSNPKQMRFVAPLLNDGVLKIQSFYVTSTDGVAMTSITSGNINCENASNKRENLENPNNTTYPTTKVVADELAKNSVKISNLEKELVNSFEDDDYSVLYDATTHVLTKNGNPIKPMTYFNSVFDAEGNSLDESIRALEKNDTSLGKSIKDVADKIKNTVVLNTGSNFDEQVTMSDTIYKICYEFDLNNKVITIPKNCTLKFEGGSLTNGTLNGNNTIIDGNLNKIFGDINFIGKFIITEISTDILKEPNKVNSLKKLIDLSNEDIYNKIIIKSYIDEPYQVTFDKVTSIESHGLVIKSNTDIILNADIEFIDGNKTDKYRAFYILDVSNVNIEGNGTLIGDYYTHTLSHESCHGLTITNSKNITVKGISCKWFWGDGLVINNSTGNNSIITIENVNIFENRRNNIYVNSGTVVFNNIYCHDIDPEKKYTNFPKGLDIEPHGSGVYYNVSIDNSIFKNNGHYDINIPNVPVDSKRLIIDKCEITYLGFGSCDNFYILNSKIEHLNVPTIHERLSLNNRISNCVIVDDLGQSTFERSSVLNYYPIFNNNSYKNMFNFTKCYLSKPPEGTKYQFIRIPANIDGLVKITQVPIHEVDSEGKEIISSKIASEKIFLISNNDIQSIPIKYFAKGHIDVPSDSNYFYNPLLSNSGEYYNIYMKYVKACSIKVEIYSYTDIDYSGVLVNITKNNVSKLTYDKDDEIFLDKVKSDLSNIDEAGIEKIKDIVRQTINNS